MTGAFELDGPAMAPRSGGRAKQLVVLLHGWGADGNDLIGLAPHWGETLPDAAFVSPHAPYPCEAGFGRQWFSIQDRTPEVVVAGVRVVAPLIDALLDRTLAEHALGPEALAIVGFSQGTMMALHVGPRRERALAALVGYSGRLVGGALLETEVLVRPPVMLIHGSADDMVPAQSMEEAGDALKTAGFTVETHLRPGLGHGIDPEGIALAGRFLAASFADAAAVG